MRAPLVFLRSSAIALRPSTLGLAIGLAPMLGCGGATAPLPSDAGASESRDVVEIDSFAPEDAERPDSLAEAGLPDASPPACSSLNVGDGGRYLSCQQASCPVGSVCVDGSLGAGPMTRCVSIPPACGGTPTCACMQTQAFDCFDPSDSGFFFGCTDVANGGMPYLSIACRCP
jgi:hypothetical protein